MQISTCFQLSCRNICAGGCDDYTIKVTIKKGESNLVNKDGGEKTLTVNCNNGNIDIDFMK